MTSTEIGIPQWKCKPQSQTPSRRVRWDSELFSWSLSKFDIGWSFTSAIDLYLNAGVPAKKINAGMPLYGRVWTLDDANCNTPGCAGTAGVAGRCTAEVFFSLSISQFHCCWSDFEYQKGYLSYFEIKEIADALAKQNLVDSAIHFVPEDGYYMVFDNQWVGYVTILEAWVRSIDVVHISRQVWWRVVIPIEGQRHQFSWPSRGHGRLPCTLNLTIRLLSSQFTST